MKSMQVPTLQMMHFRHRGELVPVRVIPQKDDVVRIEFASAQRAISAGQSAVFYKDNICLGGGIIIG